MIYWRALMKVMIEPAQVWMGLAFLVLLWLKGRIRWF